MNVTRGSATSSTITLTSIGEFAGTVDLTMSISPSNAGSPTLRLNPNRITLLSGGTGNAVLTINTIGTTQLGTYTIVVLGVTGTLANSVSINLIVRWKLTSELVHRYDTRLVLHIFRRSASIICKSPTRPDSSSDTRT